MRSRYRDAGAAHRDVLASASQADPPLSQAEWRVLGAVIAFTVSYSKIEDAVALGQIAGAAGFSRRWSSKILRRLMDRGLIEYIPGDGRPSVKGNGLGHLSVVGLKGQTHHAQAVHPFPEEEGRTDDAQPVAPFSPKKGELNTHNDFALSSNSEKGELTTPTGFALSRREGRTIRGVKGELDVRDQSHPEKYREEVLEGPETKDPQTEDPEQARARVLRELEKSMTPEERAKLGAKR